MKDGERSICVSNFLDVVGGRIAALELKHVSVKLNPVATKGVVELRKLYLQRLVLESGLCCTCKYFKPEFTDLFKKRVALKCLRYHSPTGLAEEQGGYFNCRDYEKG
jgi:hypothetical protein